MTGHDERVGSVPEYTDEFVIVLERRAAAVFERQVFPFVSILLPHRL